MWRHDGTEDKAKRRKRGSLSGQSLSVYLMPGFEPLSDELAGLGKYSTGKGCLYINKLSDVDVAVLENIIRKSFELSMQQH